MRLAGIHPGDIIQADGTWWQVTGRETRRLVCVHLQSRSCRRFTASEVNEHWRHRVQHGEPLRPVPGPEGQ